MTDLNERTIKTAANGDVLWDAKIRGLHLRCFPENKVFYVFYRTKAGKQRRPRLGTYGTMTLAQARKVAQEMLVQVASGHDPAQLRYDARAEPTVADLWAEYWKRHGSHKKSAAEDKRLWTKFLMPKLAGEKLSAVQYKDVADLHEAISKKTPGSANRVLSLASKMFNFAIAPLRWAKENPCKGVKRNPENKRKRYMRGEEAAKLAEILDREAEKNPASVAFIYLLILTGARRGEIAAARWEWIRGNQLHLPDSKTGEKVVYLPQQAMEVLARLPRTNGTITGILRPTKLWERIRVEAGCPDLRLHDLRHSFASAAISAGLSLAQIGELLGHKSTQTTKRYAHLVEEVAHAATTKVADQIMASMRKEKAPA